MILKFLLIGLLFLLGCSTTDADKQLKRRNLDEYFSGSGVVKYFLSDLPNWANFSQTASCQRTISPRYLNINTLISSYSYKYEEAVQLQYMYNVEMNKLKKRTESEYLPFSDEEKLFFTLSDKIQADIRTFRAPTFKRVNLIWIDPLLKNKNGYERLMGLLNGEAMEKGHPVLISLCMNHFEFEDYLSKRGLLNRNIRYIPYEMFSAFSVKGEQEPIFQLHINEFFKNDQRLFLYIPKGSINPSEFVGKFKL
ncbi:MAG: hypothetical protein ACJAT2_003754, partial [Bacteriovoracaceae bacterium]